MLDIGRENARHDEVVGRGMNLDDRQSRGVTVEDC